MSTNNTEPVTIAIARTGTFTDKAGKAHSFSTSCLDTIAASYDPAKAEAPLVFGHPKDNQPAYGWVDRVFRRGATLFAQLSHVPDTVRKAVRDKHYKYVSMSLQPDGKTLRHVGLLGAVPPAITGLGPVEMSSDGDMTINFAAAELETDDAAAANQGADTMSGEMSERIGALEEKIKSLTAQVGELTAARDKAQTEAKEATDKAAQAESAKADAEKAVETTKAEFSAYRGQHEKAARETRLEKLVQAGKITPGEKADTLAQAEALALIPQEMEFSSGEKLTPEEQFWKSLEARPVSPLLGTFTPPAEFSQGAEKTQRHDLSKKI